MFELWKEQIPGFEDSYYIGSGPYIGVRETRRIDGQYVLTEHDIQAERQFADAVATGCWYMDLQPNYPTPGGGNAPVGSLQGLDGFQPAHYDIPYRSLLPRKVANLLVAGRCHSATRLAASSTRVTATAMAMGQAGVRRRLWRSKGEPPCRNWMDGRCATSLSNRAWTVLWSRMTRERQRFAILALLFIATALNAIDRQTLSVLAPTMRRELHLSEGDYAT